MRILRSQLEKDAVPVDALIAGKQPKQRVAPARTREVALDTKVKRVAGYPGLWRLVPRAADLPEKAVGSGAPSNQHGVEEQPEQAAASKNRARQRGERGEAEDGGLSTSPESIQQHEAQLHAVSSHLACV